MANKISSSDASDDFVYEVCFLSLEGGNIACSSSVRIWTEGLDAGDYIGFDVLFIAGGVGAHSAAGNERLLCWPRTIYPKTANVTPIAEGCAVLAAAGLVRNREAPREPRACAIRSPSESGIHHDSLKSALAIIKRDLGGDVARGVADRLMPAWSIELVPRLNDAGTTSMGDKIRASARWLHENCERTISVADAAEIAAMSERHFLRCFKLEMGITPSDYLLQARLDTACSLLSETELPIDKIAQPDWNEQRRPAGQDFPQTDVHLAGRVPKAHSPCGVGTAAPLSKRIQLGGRMKRFIEGESRKQVTLHPECLDDFIAEDNPVTIIEAFSEELGLAGGQKLLQPDLVAFGSQILPVAQQ